MPEGDTIFRAARTLHRALAGKRVTRFETVLPALSRIHQDTPLTRRTVKEVRAAGKHLLMRLAAPAPLEQGALILRTHMRMNGSWHIYRPGERWRRPPSAMRIVIGVEDFVAVAFNVPVAELLSERAAARQPVLRALGPDLLAPGFDETEALRRLRAVGERTVADAVIDQRVMAGAGNVYKSEVLFACRIDPFAAVRTLSADQLLAILRTARRFLSLNVMESSSAAIVTSTGLRRTTRRADSTERLWVYGRGNAPCRRCGTPIASLKHGLTARLTYWCPTCQPPAPAR